MTRHLARAFYLGHARRHARVALDRATDALVYLWLAARATDECVVVARRGITQCPGCGGISRCTCPAWQPSRREWTSRGGVA